MRKSTLLSLAVVFSTFLFATGNHPSALKAGFTLGNPDIRSINAMDFGPEGILFIGDSENAQVIAVDTRDEAAAETPGSIDFERVDEYLAAMLGTTANELVIQDMAVNPASRAVYLAVHLQDGTPILTRLQGEDWKVIPLDKVSHSKVALEKSVGADAKDGRGRPLRKWAVSDLAYHDGKVMVSGLSNEEFSSTFRTIPFPFKGEQQYSSLEIYHAAHGRYETYAPIKTFMPYEFNGQLHLVASYTCTPLVIVPMNEFKPGQHTKGRTVAELGNRNTPLDIVSYQKDGKSYLLLANTSRALMKIDPAKIEAYENYLTEPVEESSATAGVNFIALPYVHVQQMDKLSDEQIVVLQRMDNGDLNLHTIDGRRL